MATNSVTYKTLDTAIRNHVIPDLAQGDVIFQQSAFFDKMSELKKVHAGTGIEYPIEYAKNPNFGTFNKHTQFKMKAQDPLTKGVLSWKNYYVNVLISDHEVRMQGNSIEKLLDIVTVQIDNGMKTMKSAIAEDLFSDGSPIADGDEGDTTERDRIDGLAAICAVSTAYAGITPSTTQNVWWQPFAIDVNATTYPGTGAASPFPGSVVLADMTDSTKPEFLPDVITLGVNRASNGRDRTDLIITDESTYRLLNKIYLSKQSIMRETQLGKLGFPALEYYGIPIVYDQNCPAGYMYGLNTSKLRWDMLSGAELTWSGLAPIGGGVEGKCGQFILSCNPVCRARHRQWVAYNIPTA